MLYNKFQEKHGDVLIISFFLYVAMCLVHFTVVIFMCVFTLRLQLLSTSHNMSNSSCILWILLRVLIMHMLGVLRLQFMSYGTGLVENHIFFNWSLGKCRLYSGKNYKGLPVFYLIKIFMFCIILSIK